jgi:hypothetical protein
MFFRLGKNRVCISFVHAILHFDYISDGVWETIGCLTDFAVLGRSFAKAIVAFSFLPVLLEY